MSILITSKGFTSTSWLEKVLRRKYLIPSDFLTTGATVCFRMKEAELPVSSMTLILLHRPSVSRIFPLIRGDIPALVFPSYEQIFMFVWASCTGGLPLVTLDCQVLLRERDWCLLPEFWFALTAGDLPRCGVVDLSPVALRASACLCLCLSCSSF